jgi:hypothetical protein
MGDCMDPKVKEIYRIILHKYGPYECPVSIKAFPPGFITIYTNYDRAREILRELEWTTE